MPAFAEIVLVTTLCLSTGSPTTGASCAQEYYEPETWSSANVVEAAQDWEECLTMRKGYKVRPGVVTADCRYVELMGANYAHK